MRNDVLFLWKFEKQCRRRESGMCYGTLYPSSIIREKW